MNTILNTSGDGVLLLSLNCNDFTVFGKFEPRMLHHNENETPPGVSFLLLCRNNTGREPEGRERKMRGSGGASNSERVKPPEGGGADRQTCQRQGCKAPYAPPLKILEISIVSGIFLFDGNP